MTRAEAEQTALEQSTEDPQTAYVVVVENRTGRVRVNSHGCPTGWEILTTFRYGREVYNAEEGLLE